MHKEEKLRKLSGGAGPFFMNDGSTLLNDTNDPVELHAGYSTTACGYADSIILMPGEVGRKVTNGSPRDFSSWEMWDDDGSFKVDYRVTEVPKIWW